MNSSEFDFRILPPLAHPAFLTQPMSWSAFRLSALSITMTLLMLGLLTITSTTRAAEPPPAVTPVQLAQLDATTFADWVDGVETPIPTDRAKNGPRDVIWTAQSRVDWPGVPFGVTKTPGVRYLRIGFTEPIPVGSVLVRGGGTLSVLKTDAAYPGDLSGDASWLPAERLALVGIPTDEAQELGKEDFAIWVLPPGTTTRALRFTHTSVAADTDPAGWLGGVLVRSDRIANLAPQATVSTASREELAARINDESTNNIWQVWDNGEQGRALAISADHPEVVTLTWSNPVELRGVFLMNAGLGAATVDVSSGAMANPLANTPSTPASTESWQTVAGSDTLDPLYPLSLGPIWLDFGKTFKAKCLRLTITAVGTPDHPHVKEGSKNGHRVWLGELMAVSSLGEAALATVAPRTVEPEPQPPIPIKFTLDEPGVVTLVIEDEAGQRVRNLVSETPFPAGENVIGWDGSDDLLRDTDAASHGLYHVPTRLVAPGKYHVRGIVRDPLALRYEMSIYSAGKPAWETADKTGAWMTNHTPPTSIACVSGHRTKDGRPLVFMGAFVAEGGHGLQWVTEDGTKVGGQGWIGGNWTGAPTLAVDRGPRANPDHLVYAGSVWEGELRLTAKTKAFGDQPILKLKLGEDPSDQDRPKNASRPKNLVDFDGGEKEYVLADIAAQDGMIVCSLVRQNELLIIDIATGKATRKILVDNPRGLAFDAKGRLLVLSKTSLLRFETLDAPPSSLITTGLDDPRHLAVGNKGDFWITDRGTSHQVKHFAADGSFLGAIGKPGPPTVGKYDPLHMNNPNGVGIDTSGEIWVAEDDFHPKRVSVWSADGKLIHAYYGPGEYGGGGVLDPVDKTRFFYKGQEFRLAWDQRRDELTRIFFRPGPMFEGPYGPYSPDTPLYPESRPGERYFTSCYTHNPTNGDGVSFLWKDEDEQARFVAALGSAQDWNLLKTDAFRACWPEGVDPAGDRNRNQATFVWSDANGDGQPQPDEVRMVKTSCSGVVNQNDLSFVIARFGDEAVQFVPAGFNQDGVPIYDLDQPKVLIKGTQSPRSSGGDQALTEPSGWTVTTVAPEPFSAYGLGGAFQGQPRWTYPSLWPGLHASHEAAVPDRPGMVVGPTRLLGGWIQPRGDAGPLFGINANMGNMYLFTADGLFVGTLFHDIRLRPNWGMPTATAGMDVSDVSLHDENFWPSLTQTADGSVYVVDGGRVSLVRVDGLDTIRRFDAEPVQVTTDDLARAQEWMTAAEIRRQAAQGSGTLKVTMTRRDEKRAAPTVDGKLDDWPATTDWATIDRRGIRANFNSNSQPYDASAAVTVVGDRLYAAWRTNEKQLLQNEGSTPLALFKTGGGLDLMLGTDPSAVADRAAPVAGDLRLLVAEVNGQPRAMLYRARVAGTTDPVPFSSPWRTITLDRTDDVSDQITFAAGGDGNYEISVPLTLLDWHPKPGEHYRADLGVLRGDGHQTTQRVYWSNKATAITADVPSEAELTPRFWGGWEIVQP